MVYPIRLLLLLFGWPASPRVSVLVPITLVASVFLAATILLAPAATGLKVIVCSRRRHGDEYDATDDQQSLPDPRNKEKRDKSGRGSAFGINFPAGIILTIPIPVPAVLYRIPRQEPARAGVVVAVT
jgi:hypothetical protein